MKTKNLFVYALLSIFISIASCNAQTKTTSSASKASKSTSVLGGIINKITGTSSLTNKDLVGKWEFQGTDCAFETDNLLKKAGGAIVATQVEAKFDDMCKKTGIKTSNTSFTFNADSTYSARLGLGKISGKYLVNDSTHSVTMSYMFGIGKLHAVAKKSGSDLKLLFDADSMLKLMKVLSKFTSDTSVEVLGKMADMYDGMLLGFDMKKQ